MIDYVTLKLIWWGIFGFLITAFMITGGMDIGVGFLLPVIGKNDNDRRLILNAIGPTWEGNQVWLITLGAGLFAIWPIAYATIFSCMYLAFVLVLVMLILRPPGIDYRSKINSNTWRSIWDVTLFTSNLVLALGFGLVVGNLFTGLPFYFDQDMRIIYQGDFLSIISPCALLFAVVTLCMLGLQGALYLQYKLDESMQDVIKLMVKIFGIGFIVTSIFAGISVVLWVPGYEIISIPDINTGISVIDKTVQPLLSGWAQNYAGHKWLWIFPIFALIFTRVAMKYSSFNKNATALFVNSAGIACATTTVGVALFPFIIPSNIFPSNSLTIWDVCSSALTLQWSFVVTLLLLPLILFYTIWVYRVMRGKVKLEENSY